MSGHGRVESEQDRINALAVAEVSKEAQQQFNASKVAAGKSALGIIIALSVVR